jgi:rhamnosyltransferase
LPNYENFGIAKALNQGCQKAVAMNYEWVLTMDQDSKWKHEECLKNYLFQIKALSESNNKNVSFSPNMINIDADEEKAFFNKGGDKYSNVKIAWTSGNVVKLSAWMELNGFNESLFIDDVDHEFCYRLRGRGYNIIKIENSYMNHEIGDHKGVRYYYIVRNCLYMKKNFPEFWDDYNRLEYLLKIIAGRIKRLHFSELQYIWRGIIDARNNKYGKYHE